MLSGDDKGRVRVWWVGDAAAAEETRQGGGTSTTTTTTSASTNAITAPSQHPHASGGRGRLPRPKSYSHPHDAPLPGLRRLLHNIDGTGWDAGGRLTNMKLVGTTLWVAGKDGGVTRIELDV